MISRMGAYLSETIVRMGAYINLYVQIYYMMTTSERISNVLLKKVLEKNKTVMNFHLNTNRDGMREGKVAKTVVRIIF